MNEHDSHELGSDADLVRLIRIAGVRMPVEQERTARVRRAVETEWKNAVAEHQGPARRVLLAAAAAAILIVVAIIAVRSSTRTLPVGSLEIGTVTMQGTVEPAGVGTIVPTRTLIATTSEAPAAIRLDSGASLRLDRETRIEFDTPGVIRLIAGAVYVDSPPGVATGQLVIIAANVMTREIGTQFETRLVGDDVVVRVREGRVEVSAGESLIAEAGTKITVSSSGSLVRDTTQAWGEEWSWVLESAPAFEIEGRTVAEFLAWASRETGLEVDTGTVSDELVRTTRLHGSIEGMTPQEAIEAVLPASSLEVEITDGRVTLDRPARSPAN